MTRLYIFIASIALTLALSGCGIASGDGPLFKPGGLADRVGNFSTVRMGKRNDRDRQPGGFTPLNRRLADGSAGEGESNSDDDGYGYGSYRGDDGDGDYKGKKKHKHKKRHKNQDGNPLFGQSYEGNGRGSADLGGDNDGEPRGYDRIKLPEPGTTGSAKIDYSAALDAQAKQAQNVNVTVTANIFRLLPDDRRGSPHERFLIELPNGSTVLIAHNINLAPYVPLDEGDLVTISGEYVWNQKGGVIHYTHRPTNARHKGGFIECDGKRYW